MLTKNQKGFEFQIAAGTSRCSFSFDRDMNLNIIIAGHAGFQRLCLSFPFGGMNAGALRTRTRLTKVMMKIATCIACALFVSGWTPSAFALAGELTEPGLAFPDGFSEPARTNIMAALRQPNCKFLGGHFINSFTTLKYGGDTFALNLFLERLVKCPGAVLRVRFQTDLASDECDWFVHHLAGKPREFTVYVNPQSPRVVLDKLTIPDSKGPPVPEAK